MGFNLRVVTCILFLFLAAMPPCFAAAGPSISLSFYKDNGYGFGNDIGGLWTVTAEASPDVAYVEFYLDDRFVQNDTSAPFSWQFHTADYPTGAHSIRAVAFDSMGKSETAAVERNFQEAPTESVASVIVAVVVVVIAVSVGFAVYRSRKVKNR